MTPRNPYVPAAKSRKAGKIKSVKDKRLTGKNQQRELLKEREQDKEK